MRSTILECSCLFLVCFYSFDVWRTKIHIFEKVQMIRRTEIFLFQKGSFFLKDCPESVSFGEKLVNLFSNMDRSQE